MTGLKDVALWIEIKIPLEGFIGQKMLHDGKRARLLEDDLSSDSMHVYEHHKDSLYTR